MAQVDNSRLAGTLIGSILESAGYHYQESVLEVLGAPFENELGGLLYLVAIILAVVHTATRGGFKQSAWLLIGPPLFFAVLQVKEPISNARWQFGNQERPNDQVEQGVQEIAPDAAGEAEVSSVFARFVRLSSETVRAIVDTISENRENTDLWFLVRAQLFALMHTAEIQDPGLSEMLHRSVMIDCAEVVRWAEMVNDPVFREIDGDDQQVAAIAASVQQAREWFQPSREYAQLRFNKLYHQRNIRLGEESARFVATRRLMQADGTLPNDVELFTEEVQRVQAKTYSCFEVWRWVVDAIMEDATRRHESLLRTASGHGIPEGLLNRLMLSANGVTNGEPLVFGSVGNNPALSAADVQRIRRIIALYYLRNETTNPDRSAWISWMSGRHEARILRLQMQGESSMSERSRVSVLEWSEKERLIHAASSLPYYQGLILYFLGALFPFFALLLLIPGKHGGFLLWFSLWFWAKSWDIGFAVVMLLDDLLFAMFAVERREFGQVQELSTEAAEIGLAMASLQELDPTFQLATYYSLIAVAVLAIPVVSAQLFLGAMAGGAGLISEGARSFAAAFAESARSHTVRDAMAAIRHDTSELLKQRAHLVQQKMEFARKIAMENKGAPVDMSNFPGIGAWGTGNQYQTSQSSPPPQSNTKKTADQLKQMAESAGKLQGMGASNALQGKNDKMFNNVMAGVKYGLGGAPRNAQLKGALQKYMADSRYQSLQMQWQLVHEQISDLHVRAAPLGILPLPATGFFNEPSMEEYKIAETVFTKKMELQKSYLETYTKLTKIAIDVASDLLPEKYKPGPKVKAAAGGTAAVAFLSGLAIAHRNTVMKGVQDRIGTTWGGATKKGPATDQMADWLKAYGQYLTKQTAPQPGALFLPKSASPEPEVNVGRRRYVDYNLHDRPYENGPISNKLSKKEK